MLDDPPLLIRHAPKALRTPELEAFAAQLCERVAKGKAFTVLITNDAALRRMNREFLGHDHATDVLSFPARPEAPELGEIAISHQRAKAQALEYGHDTETEIRTLMLHGVLHLAGYDHETDGGRMRAAETRWRKKLGLARGLIERTA